MQSHIELKRKNGTIILDKEDYERIIEEFSISLGKTIFESGRIVYMPLVVTRGSHRTRKMFYLHRVILGVIDGEQFIDHVNGNRLDNRRSNLRLCTRSQNNANSVKVASSAPYKGVKKTKHNRFVVSIRKDTKKVYLGTFRVAVQAAMAYDNAARKYFGEFARPNFETILQYKKALKAELYISRNRIDTIA